MLDNNNNEAQEMTLNQKLDDMRVRIKHTANFVNSVKNEVVNRDVERNENKGEVIANLTLAYRHLEDASMRIGKVKQARNDGVSIYDNIAMNTPKN